MSADTLDVIAWDEAAEALRAPASKRTQLERLITAVSRRFDREFGAVVSRAVTDELHRSRGASAVLLDFWPTSSVVVTESTGATFTVDNQWGVIYYRELVNGLYQPAPWVDTPSRDLSVDYTAGRFATTADVDADWREAAVITLRQMWHSSNPSTVDAGEYEYTGPTFPRFVIPNAVFELLAPYRRRTFGIG